MSAWTSAAFVVVVKPPGGGASSTPERRMRERESSEAKDLYDLGRFALRQQGTTGFRKAIELFERATRVDPDFAEAWSGLAVAYLGLVGMTAVPSLPDVAAAKSAVLRALGIDPQSGEACSSLASGRCTRVCSDSTSSSTCPSWRWGY